MESCLVVPAYNESARVDVAAYVRALEANPALGLILVDDGSRDATLERLAEIQRAAPTRVRLLPLPRNVGKAEAVRQGLLVALDADAPVIGYLDADLAADFAEVTRLRACFVGIDGPDVVIGSRVKLLGRHVVRRESRHYLGRLFATMASIALGLPIYDTQCGLKLMHNDNRIREALRSPFVSRWLFDVELIGRLHRLGARFREEPLERWEDVAGSRLRASDFLHAPLQLWQIRRALRSWSCHPHHP